MDDLWLLLLQFLSWIALGGDLNRSFESIDALVKFISLKLLVIEEAEKSSVHLFDLTDLCVQFVFYLTYRDLLSFHIAAHTRNFIHIRILRLSFMKWRLNHLLHERAGTRYKRAITFEQRLHEPTRFTGILFG